jgi:hypothetical protein
MSILVLHLTRTSMKGSNRKKQISNPNSAKFGDSNPSDRKNISKSNLMTASNHNKGHSMPLSSKCNHVHPNWCNDPTICHNSMCSNYDLHVRLGMIYASKTKNNRNKKPLQQRLLKQKSSDMYHVNSRCHGKNS